MGMGPESGFPEEHLGTRRTRGGRGRGAEGGNGARERTHFDLKEDLPEVEAVQPCDVHWEWEMVSAPAKQNLKAPLWMEVSVWSREESPHISPR